MEDVPAHPDAPATGWTAIAIRWICAGARSRAHAGVTVLIALTLAAIATWWGSGIRVNTDLRALLPGSAPSARALQELTNRRGTTELFTIAIEEDDAYERERMFEELVSMVGSWPETMEVYDARDYTGIRDHTLYFLPLDDLQTLRDTLVRERQRAVARSIAIGSGDGPPPEAVTVGEDDWDSWDEPVGGSDEPSGANPDGSTGGADDDAFDLRAWIENKRGALAQVGMLTDRELDLIWPAEDEEGVLVWRDRVVDPYVSPDGRVQVLKASLSRAATDVRFAHEITKRTRARVDELQRYGVAPDARVQVVGSYSVTREIDTIVTDAKRATWISVIGVAGVLVLGFRRVRSLILVLVPIVVATGLTLAVTRVTLGTLNALTLFMFAVLFGMGVDFAVHLYAHRRQSAAPWPEILGEQLRPLLATMLTTAASLAVLSAAEFKAFREFGGLSAVGVAIAFACALILVPALDVLLGSERRPKTPPTRSRRVQISGVARGLLLAGLAAFAALGAPRADFERDLSKLTVQRRGRDRIRHGAATGRCSASIVLVAEDAAGLETAYQALVGERDAGVLLRHGATRRGQPAPWVRDLFTLEHSLPPAQADKQPVLAEIHEQASDFLAELDERDPEAISVRSHLEALERLSRADPLTPDELPQWAAEPFRERDGRMDRIGHLCPHLRGNHLDELVSLKSRLDTLLPESVQAADARLVFGDLVEHIRVDSKRLPLLALGVIVLLIALDLRRVRATIACFGALVLGVGFTLGLMGLWPLKVNFFNLVVMPAVLGLSIDASIHLWHARNRPSFGATARASLVAALTTVAGFSGLLAARHPGLRSIGELGVLAVVGCVGVAFLTLYPSRGE